METLNAKQTTGVSQHFNSGATILRNLYLLNGNTLLPLSSEYLDAHSPAEKNFRSAKEFEELVLKNSKVLFGQNTLVVPMQKKDGDLFGKDFTPSGFLLDLSNLARPKFYVLEIMLAKENFYGYVFPRMTKFFFSVGNQNVIERLCELFSKNKEVKGELDAKMEPDDVPLYLRVLISKPSILLVMDREMKELPEVMETYPNPWQMVKPVLLKKYASNGNTFCTMTPPFATLNRVNSKERKIREEIVYTEEQRLENASDEMREIYGKLKTALLKIDKELQFNPQKYYISLRKNRNVAFFHFKRKKISIVMMISDKEARKFIKHHEVKTLAESVQKFWNGSSCNVDVVDTKYLNEVIGLLKKLITA